MKKHLALLLALIMIFQMFPVSAFAEGDSQATHLVAGEEVDGSSVGSIGDGEAAAPAEKALEATESNDIVFAAAADEGELETWTVTYRDRDGENFLEEQKVVRGEAIGTLRGTTDVERDDYTVAWAIGSSSQGEQGTEWTAGQVVDASYVPESDITLIPKYEQIKYTITFYEDVEKTSVLATKEVSSDTSYVLNDIPAVPAKDGYTGKWVYADGDDFTNQVAASANMEVWPEYSQTVFTVTFIVNDNAYATDTYYSGNALELPADPVVEGKEFQGWFVGETQYEGGEAVEEDLTITASFKDEFDVKFVILNDDGTMSEQLDQYFRTGGQTIGTMPENPFVEGKVFEKWVTTIDGEEVVVTADTPVNSSMTVVAVFRTIDVYTITAKYWYQGNSGEVVFETQIFTVQDNQLRPDPYSITVPASTKTDPDEVAGGLTYYPVTTTVAVPMEGSAEGVVVTYDEAKKAYTVKVRYVEYTAEYDFVYLLKDLTGDGYAEIESEHVYGVLGSYVSPTVKTYDYATLESADGADVIQATGQRFEVKYTRKSFTLSYETNGGSYVQGGTYLYGVSAPVSSTTPTRNGYTFAGWYTDEALTAGADPTVTIEGDTILYAKWNGNTVNYNIIYMKEQYVSGSGNSMVTTWVYDSSRTVTGTVGTTVYAANAQNSTSGIPNGYEKTTAINGTSTAAGTGADTAITVSADGSATLKVYYSLIRYTLVFNINKTNGRISMNGNTYTGLNYRISGVVLGQDVSSMWPCTNTEIYDTSRQNKQYFEYWTGATGQYVTRRYELVWDNVTGANTNHVQTYTAHWKNSDSNRNAEYWLQQTDGTYKREDAYTQTGLNTDSLSAKNIDGYTKHSGTPRGYTGSGWSGSVYTWRFYYDRAQYKIDYYYGTTLLTTKSNIYFEADISSSTYNYTPNKPANTSTIDYSDYIWGGWYDNSGLTGDSYTFDTMPGNNLVLYAKWVAPTFTVNFEMDGGTPAAESQIVSKYGRAEKPENPTKLGYTFDGWYTSADGDTLYDWNNQIVVNTTIYAHWTMDPLSYTVHYVDENGATLAADKVVTKADADVGDVFTETAVTIAGYRPNVGSQNVTLALGGSEITFVYTQKADKVHYTVKYILDPAEFSGEEEISVADAITVEVDGDTLSVIELAVSVSSAFYSAHPEYAGEEFFPDESEKSLTLGADESTNVITFYYSKYASTKVKVNFVDMDGEAIHGIDSTTQILKVGKTFSLSRTPIAGWELNKAVEGTSYSGTEAGTEYKITSNEVKVFTLFYQRKLTITAKSLNKQYDGTALALTTELDGQVTVGIGELLEGHTLTSVTLNYTNDDPEDSGSRTNAGVTTVTPSSAVINGASSNYYKIRYISGTLEVTPLNVSVRVEPDRWTGNIYDGTVKKTGFTNGGKHKFDDRSGNDTKWYVSISNAQYQTTYGETIWNGILSKVTYDESAAGFKGVGIAKSDAGNYSYEVPYTVADLPDNPNYSVSLYVRQGRLEIKPKDITITTGSDSKAYDGEPLTKDEATITGLVETDEGKVTIAATGSQIEVGSSDNTYEITWGDVKSDNYKIAETNLGTLEVTPIYKVEFYYQNDAGTAFEKDDDKTATRTAETGATVEVTAEDKASSNPKYIFDEENTENVLTGTVSADNDLVLKVYFKLNLANYTIHHYLLDTTIKVADDQTGQKVIGKDTLTATAYATSAEELYDNYKTVVHKKYSPESNSVTISVDPATNVITVYYVIPLTITVNGATKAYNGQTQYGNTVNGAYAGTGSEIKDEANTYSITGLVSGDSLTISGYVPSSGKTANTYDNGSFEDATITITNNGTDITTAYDISTVKGNLVIEKDEKTLAVESKSQDWDYDAETHTYKMYVVTYGDETLTGTEGQTSFTLSTGDTVTVTPTGKGAAGVKNVSDSDKNAFTWTVTNSDSYTIGEDTVGDLKINKVDLTIEMADRTEKYNGETQYGWSRTDEGKETVTGLVHNETVEIDYTPSSGKTVDTYDNGSYDEATLVVKDGEEDVTENYNLTGTTAGKLTITKTTKEVKIVSEDQTWEYDSADHDYKKYTITFGDETISGTEGQVEFTLSTGDKITISDAATVKYVADTKAENNTYSYVLDYADQYETIGAEYGTLTITLAPLTITADSNSKEYDGTPLTDDGWNDTAPVGLKGTDKVETVVVTGTITEVGTEKNVASKAVVKNGEIVVTDNYEIEYVDGELKITQTTKALKITSGDKTWMYDGDEHSYAQYTVTFGDDETITGTEGQTEFTLSTGDKITISDPASVKNVSDTADENNTYKYVLENADQYASVTAEYGKLTITQRSVTLTSATDSKVYDGTALTNDEVTVSGDGFVKSEGATYDVTGTQTLVGESDNTFTYTLTGGATEGETGNYVIKTVFGTLTVTDGTDPGDEPVDPELVVTKADAGKGPYHVGDTVTFNITATNIYEAEQTITLSEIENVTLAQATFEAVEGGATVTTTATYVITVADIEAGEFKNTVTAEMGSIEKEAEATVKTEKVEIEITAASDSKVYDSKPLTNDGYELTSGELVNGDKIDSVTVTGSQTLVGSSENVASEAKIVNADGADVTKGYEITYKPGTLKVTDGTEPDDPEEVDDDLVVTKSHEAGTFGLGDTVTFNITATNIYEEARTITLTEIEGVTLAQSVFENVEGGETISTTATYTIKEADILAQSFTNTVTAAVGNITKTADDTVTADEIEDPNPSLKVEKTTTSEAPEDGYALGDTITYKITVTNDGNLTISDITVTDTVTGYEAEDITDKLDKTELKPGEVATATFEHEVTEQDILAGSVKNEATAKGNGPDDHDPDPEPGTTEDPVEDLDTTMTVNKKITNTPADGDAFKLGETIEYSITVKNEGNVTYNNIVVEDDLTGLKETIEALGVGEEKVFTTKYVVTEADILAGSVKNTATAAGDPIDDPKDPENPKTPEGEDTTETGDKDDPDGPNPPIEEKNPHMAITKTITSGAGPYSAGQVVTFAITVENDGNVTLSDITVTDQFEGLEKGAIFTAGEGYTVSGSTATVTDSLAPGENITLTASYTVVPIDESTGLTNVATAKGKDPEDDDPEVDPGEVDVPITPTMTSSTVQKVWLQDNWEDRPQVLGVMLYRSVNGSDGVPYDGREIGITAAGGWTTTYDGLPGYENGVMIDYYWIEVDVPEGYVAGYDTTDFNWQTNGHRTTIFNTVDTIIIDDLETPLGLAGVYNNLGECFE